MAGLYLSCTRHWRSAMLPWFSPTCCYPQSTPLVFVPRNAPLPLTPQTRLNAFPTSLSRKEETTESPSVKITWNALRSVDDRKRCNVKDASDASAEDEEEEEAHFAIAQLLSRDHHSTTLTRGSSHYGPSCVPSWMCHWLDEEFIPHPLTIRVVQAKPIFIF
jgi:hypothetical protein